MKECLDCNILLSTNPKAKRCRSCAQKHRFIKENCPMFGKQHTVEAKKKQSLCKLGIKNPTKRLDVRKKLSKNHADVSGKKHPQFKGKILNRGYVYIYSPNHPFKTTNNIVLEHRLIMEKHLGRYLHPTEVVHHKNEIRTDNRLNNLQLFDSNNSHILFHRKKRENKNEI